MFNPDDKFELDANWILNQYKLEELPKLLRLLERVKVLAIERIEAGIEPANKLPPRREPATPPSPVGKKA